MSRDGVDIFWAGFLIGLCVGVVITLVSFLLFSGNVVYEKTAVEKGAAVYRIKPGTLNEVEFVWKCDLGKEWK